MGRRILSSPHNPQLRRVRRWVEKPRQCRADRILLADGIHLVQEAFSAGLACVELFVDSERIDRDDAHPEARSPASSRTLELPVRSAGESGNEPSPPLSARAEIAAIVERATAEGVPVHLVVPSLFRDLAPVETPQGVLGVFERPESSDFAPSISGSGPAPASGSDSASTTESVAHVIVASGIQDPSNLGSMIRTARAAGIRELLSTRGTVDPYHHRALRASMGATFHTRVRPEQDVEPLLQALRESGRRTLALSSRGETPLDAIDAAVPSAIVFGSEGHGLPQAVESSLDLRVRIPMEPGVESLSVPAAAAIVFYWLYLNRPR